MDSLRPTHKKLVSTIIPVFNRGPMLCDAVESVLSQTYRPIEIIIIDDGSTDETSRIANELQRRGPEIIRIRRICNSGPGVAREVGRQLATGEFIQYLDSDDLLLPGKFTLQVEGLSSDRDCAISYCKTRYRDSRGNVLTDAWKRTGEAIFTLFPSMLLGRWWGTSTPLYRRTEADRVGPWSKLDYEEDWEYDCRFAARGVKLHRVSETLSEERGSAENRLSTGGDSEPNKLSSRARAHELIYAHAVAAGLDSNIPEMQQFSRELFLLCRQCGAAGLIEWSKRLFALSEQMAEGQDRGKVDFLAYAAGARLFGWRFMGIASRYMDRLRES